MALLKFAPEILGIRGSAAGATFSANKSGPYMKRFAAPVNPSTAAQQTRRTAIANIAATWRTLSSGQRTDWDDFAADPPETDYDPWGEARALSGAQWFNRINARLFSAGAAAVEDPPASTPATPVTLSSIVAHDYTGDDDDSYITFPDESFEDGSLPVLTLALVFSQGLAAPTTRNFLAYCGPTVIGDTLDIGDILKTLFGDYPASTVLYATLRRQSTTGIRSTHTSANTIVLA